MLHAQATPVGRRQSPSRSCPAGHAGLLSRERDVSPVDKIRCRSLGALSALVAAFALSPDNAVGQPVTTRISVSTPGEQANAVGEWWYLAPKVGFSANGELVAFSSDATNLAPHDTNRVSDIFVRNLITGTTHRVTVSAAWRQTNGISFGPSL